MLRRLFLLLLLAAFASPATAMAVSGCHDRAGSAPMTHHGTPAAPDKASPGHLCIGCVPVADWLAERVAPPLAVAAGTSAPAIAVLALVRGIAPALPPPRRA